MGFRFRKRIKLGPGLSLNLSKSGVSLSTGFKGLTANISPSGTRLTVGAQGTGISNSFQIPSLGLSSKWPAGAGVLAFGTLGIVVILALVSVGPAPAVLLATVGTGLVLFVRRKVSQRTQMHQEQEFAKALEELDTSRLVYLIFILFKRMGYTAFSAETMRHGFVGIHMANEEGPCLVMVDSASNTNQPLSRTTWSQLLAGLENARDNSDVKDGLIITRGVFSQDQILANTRIRGMTITGYDFPILGWSLALTSEDWHSIKMLPDNADLGGNHGLSVKPRSSRAWEVSTCLLRQVLANPVPKSETEAKAIL